MTSLNRTQTINRLYYCGEIFITESDSLTGFDREIGDANHGLNMHRGFSKVVKGPLSAVGKDIGFILKNTGTMLFSSVGGASGSLFNTSFVRVVQVTQAHQSLALGEPYQTIRGGAEGVISRGKVEPGDETMCDIWLPMVESLRQSCEQKLSVQAALEAANQQAEVTAQSAVTIQARKGRASYFGERSIGHQGPDVTSVALVMQVLAQTSRE